jgi:hypothetical protein
VVDNLHPTNREWALFDPEIEPPPAGVNLLLINEGGCLIIGPWYKGALAWGYKPVIPATVKTRVALRLVESTAHTQKQQQSENEYGNSQQGCQV